MPDKRRARIKKPRFSLHSARLVVWARHATVFVAECHANRHACKTPFTLSLSLGRPPRFVFVRCLQISRNKNQLHVHRGHQAEGKMAMRTTRRTFDVRGESVVPTSIYRTRDGLSVQVRLPASGLPLPRPSDPR